MKSLKINHLVVSLLIVMFATNLQAHPCERGQSCGEIAGKCERGCEGTSNSESCIEACRDDYEVCTSNSGRQGDLPDCDFPEVPCQVGTNKYVCKHHEQC